MFIALFEMNTIKRDSTPDGVIMPDSPIPDNTLPNAKLTHFEERHTFLTEIIPKISFTCLLYSQTNNLTICHTYACASAPKSNTVCCVIVPNENEIKPNRDLTQNLSLPLNCQFDFL